MNPIYRRAAHIVFLCALLSLVGFRVQAQSYVFGTASYSAPGLSAPIVTADFNGDGITDIVWVQPSNGQLTLWLMNAAGAIPNVVANAGTAPAGFAVFQP